MDSHAVGKARGRLCIARVTAVGFADYVGGPASARGYDPPRSCARWPARRADGQYLGRRDCELTPIGPSWPESEELVRIQREGRLTSWKRLRIWLAMKLLPTGVFVKEGMIWPENAHIELGTSEKLASLDGEKWHHV